MSCLWTSTSKNWNCVWTLNVGKAITSNRQSRVKTAPKTVSTSTSTLVSNKSSTDPLFNSMANNYSNCSNRTIVVRAMGTPRPKAAWTISLQTLVTMWKIFTMTPVEPITPITPYRTSNISRWVGIMALITLITSTISQIALVLTWMTLICSGISLFMILPWKKMRYCLRLSGAALRLGSCHCICTPHSPMGQEPVRKMGSIKSS